MPASGPVSRAEQCSAGPYEGVDGVEDGVGWQHAQDNKRTPGCFCALSAWANKIRNFTFSKATPNGKWKRDSRSPPSPPPSLLLCFKYECKVNSE